MGFFSKLTGNTTISAEEAHKRMEQGGNFVLLDVRTPEEFKQVRIEGAKLIPVDQLSRAESELPDKNVPIYVYCQSGMRAATAVRTLKSMGYANAVSFGGIMNWPYERIRG